MHWSETRAYTEELYKEAGARVNEILKFYSLSLPKPK